MTELHCVFYLVGVLSGIGIALVICRFIPQRVDIDIYMMPGSPPPHHDTDSSEAWKGGQ